MGERGCQVSAHRPLVFVFAFWNVGLFLSPSLSLSGRLLGIFFVFYVRLCSPY